MNFMQECSRYFKAIRAVVDGTRITLTQTFMAQLMTDSHQTQKHLLSFVTDNSGAMVSIHADLAGVNRLLVELECIRDLLLQNDCPHTHLMATDGTELTETKLSDQQSEANIVHHVKIYGWNEEWAVKHNLRK